MSLIEKHFTLDKEMEGWDHKVSADFKEMKFLVKESKRIVKALEAIELVQLKILKENFIQKKYSFKSGSRIW